MSSTPSQILSLSEWLMPAGRSGAIVLMALLVKITKTHRLWRWKQSSANRSPPVSFPVPRENTGKFANFGLEIAKGASALGRKFNRLPTEFPSHQSRENLLAIRELEAGNSESDPNKLGLACWFRGSCL
jgi:hypothetical protein